MKAKKIKTSCINCIKLFNVLYIERKKKLNKFEKLKISTQVPIKMNKKLNKISPKKLKYFKPSKINKKLTKISKQSQSSKLSKFKPKKSISKELDSKMF